MSKYEARMEANSGQETCGKILYTILEWFDRLKLPPLFVHLQGNMPQFQFVSVAANINIWTI